MSFRNLLKFCQEVVHWSHARMRVSLPHENNVPLINADYCYQRATVVFITLLRARTIVRVKHTTQYTFEKKPPHRRWRSTHEKYFIIIVRIAYHM